MNTPSEPIYADTAAHTALHKLFQQRVDSWNQEDANAYAACFTADSDYITFDGTYLVGHAANARHHQRLFDGFLRGSRLVGQTIQDLRFLSPEVALLHASGTVQLRWQKKPLPGRLSILTLVAVRQGGDWRFTAFHNARVARHNWYYYLGFALGQH